jgi:DNA replication protein DnaC
MALAHCNGAYQTLMKQYKKVRLLILDEWLLTPLSQNEARDLLEIIETRHTQSSTIFSSQFAPPGWHSKIGEETLADAILDRIIHASYTITISGKDSMRKRKGITEEKKQ